MKTVSRREVVAASGVALLPAGLTCAAAAQAASQQAPQRAPRPAAQPGDMPAPQQSVPLTRTPLFIPEGANKPMGVGKGIYPGRVAWVHNPEVATWDGETGEWWDDANTNEAVVERMMSKSLQGLAGKEDRQRGLGRSLPSFQQDAAQFGCRVQARGKDHH